MSTRLKTRHITYSFAEGVFLAGGDNGRIGTNATFLVLPNAIGLVQR